MWGRVPAEEIETPPFVSLLLGHRESIILLHHTLSMGHAALPHAQKQWGLTTMETCKGLSQNKPFFFSGQLFQVFCYSHEKLTQE